jgi:4-hydroxy-tetrahydrodipicolinate synthase
MFGIIPPMTTPFDADGEIDEAATRAQVRWLLDRGVHGIAAGGSTGEGHTLDADELKRLVATVVEEVDGREATGQPVIIYNVVPWSYLAPGLLLHIMREVPGVIGVKQSAGDLKLVADLLLGARPEDHVFSAVDALLYPSFVLGAHGTIAALPTAAPGPCVALWDAVQRDDHATAHDLHRRLLRLWNALVGDNLPACVKHAQMVQGCPVGRPRAPMPAASPDQQRAIEAALKSFQ